MVINPYLYTFYTGIKTQKKMYNNLKNLPHLKKIDGLGASKQGQCIHNTFGTMLVSDYLSHLSTSRFKMTIFDPETLFRPK